MKKLIAACLMAMFTCVQIISAAQYQVTDLGTIGNLESFATAINNNGQVVGYLLDAGTFKGAFLYSNGSMQNLCPYGASWGINNNGQVVGQNNIGNAFLYSNGAMTDIILGAAKRINNNGQVVGYVGNKGLLRVLFYTLMV